MNGSIAPLMPLIILAIVFKVIAEFMPRRSKRRKSTKSKNSRHDITDLIAIACLAALLIAVWVIKKVHSFLRSAESRGIILAVLTVVAIVAAIAAIVIAYVHKRKNTEVKIHRDESKQSRPVLRLHPVEKNLRREWNVAECPPWAVRDEDLRPIDLSEIHLDGKTSAIGHEGESRVGHELRRLGDYGKYIVLNDLMLMGDNGETTQIDHIVVSRYGVFVLETKCFKGWIFGDEKWRFWTQSLSHRGAPKKRRFQNPIQQNWRHICVLSERLGISKDYFFNLVVFAGDAEFKTLMPNNVVTVWDVVNRIRMHTKRLIKDDQVEELASAIREWDAVITPEQRYYHVANLKHKYDGAYGD